jgi:hypothetical protein
LELKDGKLMASAAPGRYQAHVYVYDFDLPLLVDMQDVEVEAGGVGSVIVELVEGIGTKPLRQFDQDYDLVLDRVELKLGTNPLDPVSFPDAEPIPFDSPVLAKEARWYVGDLHVRSIHGGGTETVAELVKRAEKSKLDFVAITDRNTLAACYDKAFASKKVVLIPALEWGSEDKGIALIYGPSTVPQQAENMRDAQGVCQRVQAQGGIFAIAHPCFATAPWQWGVGFVNAVEVWTRGWRDVPPMGLNGLVSEYHRRDGAGNLVHSIALATSKGDLSANGQAAQFWDYELVRGLRASPIAGSQSSTPKVPMGRPLTYVYAREKSVRGILEGLRLGRTMVSSGPEGPFVDITADVWTRRDQTIDMGAARQQLTVERPDIGPGGIIPLGLPADFVIQVRGAKKGMKVELLRNGWPILTKSVEGKELLVRTSDEPKSYAVYRARVIGTPSGPGFGPVEVHAMTAPIYAQDMVPIDPRKENPFDVWIGIPNRLPPVKVSERVEEGGKVKVRLEEGANPPPAQPNAPFAPPPNEPVIPLDPKRL